LIRFWKRAEVEYISWKALGRPKRVFRRDEAMRLREQGMSWRKIAAKLNVPVTTVVEGCR
jgi:hypothetical protein